MGLPSEKPQSLHKNIPDLLREVNEHVQSVLAPSFEINASNTTTVPAPDSSGLTYDNLDLGKKDCKLLKTCVLYVDIRDSSAISVSHQPKTLAKLYSAFAKSMIQAAGHFGGTVRNIIGDRVMVVFDEANCFANAVHTATLFHTICSRIIGPEFARLGEFRCGIGIDYGQMLVTKVGSIKQGLERDSYRSLVWLGEPANVASKLTDTANKAMVTHAPAIHEGHYYPSIDSWTWNTVSLLSFVRKLKPLALSNRLQHENPYFHSFFETEHIIDSDNYPAILMTDRVYNGYKSQVPSALSLEKEWWYRQNILDVSGVDGPVWGGSVYYTAVDSIR